ncbi:transcription elongation factor A N-terminal and central domain-containing protein 2-like [Lineus longissimus]|uniref:transcription elongation factor A N-terminal and central domain-containing protein 2-like n=1 Tax=Lineus longissimus TaxID=88925 RepID=UPI002B4DB944
MDKYVVKLPGPSTASNWPSKSKGKGLKQVTIKSLTRVVVVDDIKKIKEILVNKQTSNEDLAKALKELGEKIPSKEIIMETKIGQIVRKLVRHDDEDVAKQAKAIYHKWKNFYAERSKLKPIEVKYDAKTESLRIKARKHLAIALGVQETHNLVTGIEKEAFNLCKKVSMHIYNRALRTIILKAKSDNEMKNDILNGTLPVTFLVKKYAKKGEI